MKQIFGAKGRLILSMSIFGTIGIFVRSISVSSGELALYRAVLATAILGCVILIKRIQIDLSKIKKEFYLLVASGIAMGLNWVLLFQVYHYTTVSVATLSYYFAPVLVTLICPLLFNEKMTAKNWICFLMSTIGIVLLTGLGDLNVGTNHLIGIIYGLGAACLYATVILINKAIKNVDDIPRTFLQFSSSLLILFPYVLFGSGLTPGSIDTKSFVCILIVGMVHTGANYCLYFSALKGLSGQKAAIFSYIDPLVAILASVLILNEGITFSQITGGILILGFTLWNEMPKKAKRYSSN